MAIKESKEEIRAKIIKRAAERVQMRGRPKLGRKTLPKMLGLSVTLEPDQYKELAFLSEKLETSKSTIIRYGLGLALSDYGQLWMEIDKDNKDNETG